MTSVASRRRAPIPPSLSLPQLARRWECDVGEVEDCVRADAITAHALLHEVPATIATDGTERQIPLTGHFRLTPLSAVGLLDYACTRDDVGYPPQVLLDDGTLATIDLTGRKKTREMIRILREEVLRAEREAPKQAEGGDASGGQSPVMRPSQRHRERCRAIAAMLWQRNPAITIEAMIDQDDMVLFGQERVDYGRKVLRGWIKDLCPDRSPGRRPKGDTPKTPG